MNTMPTLSSAETARFHARIAMSAECWTWTGDTNNQGYGQFALYRPHRVRILAHRLSYRLATGTDPVGLVVRHTCDNPPCVRPDHLVTGSQLENVRDAIVRGRLNLSGLAVRNERREAAIRERLEAGVKACARCKAVQPFADFVRCRSSRDGHHNECKACCRDRRKARAGAR